MSQETTSCPRWRNSLMRPAPTVPKPPVTSTCINLESVFTGFTRLDKSYPETSCKSCLKAVDPSGDRIGFERFGFHLDDAIDRLPFSNTIPNHTGFRVVGAEAVAMFKADCGSAIFFDLEIVNHNPRALRLLTSDCANRSGTLY